MSSVILIMLKILQICMVKIILSVVSPKVLLGISLRGNFNKWSKQSRLHSSIIVDKIKNSTYNTWMKRDNGKNITKNWQQVLPKDAWKIFNSTHHLLPIQ